MELLGGLLVLLAMALCGLTICAGGLCTEKKAPTEPGDQTMRRFPMTVGMTAGMFMMVVPAFAQMSGGLAQAGGERSVLAEGAIEHPSLFPFNVAGAQSAGVTERTATRVSVASAAKEVEQALWHHPLYPFVVAGEQGDVTRVAKRAQAAAVGSEPAVWHPALVPFSIRGR